MKKKYIPCILLFFVPSILFSSGAEINVFVLHSSSAEMPWVKEFNRGLEEIRVQNFPNIHFYFEFMNKDFMENRLNNQDWVYYLKEKYSEKGFDFILADEMSAVSLLDENPQLFEGVPRISSSVHLQDYHKEGALYISSNIEKSVESTVSFALQQNPKTEKIIIIDGKNIQSEPVLNCIIPFLNKHFSGNIKILEVFSMEKLLADISALDRNSVVFYTIVLADSTRTEYIPKDVLQSVCEKSRAPVYTFWSTLIGSGTVGGSMLDAGTIAKDMFREGMNYLSVGEFSEDRETMRVYWDWLALKKYDIKTDPASESVTVINRPVSPFILYYKEIITSASIVFLFLLVITFLFLHNLNRLNKELRKQKVELQKLVNEKSLLIREIDHRVKNNLFLLRGLVNLQIIEVNDPAKKSYLQNVANRISTMAIVHKRLFIAEKENAIDAKLYFEELIQEITEAMMPESKRISIDTEIQSIHINSKRATACGLIINELLSNVLKYAFPEDRSGSVKITIHSVPDLMHEIIIQDSGIGLPADFQLLKNSGIGLKVVRELTLQLHGQLNISSESGTEFKIIFPEKDQESPPNYN